MDDAFFSLSLSLSLSLSSIERFWGWKENQREIDWDRQQYVQARLKGLPHHLGESQLDPHLKTVAYRHTRFAAEVLAWAPILNFTFHNLGVNWDLYKDLEPQM
ncbi:hypothetical protein HMI54_008883 [Coelomomyces lativittatus]|nr:hypothetical protein HMI54_008883 [Coelomomyces lativittatus]KAJ1503115.1 hypothetical protein HMI55_002602 [Coelomomyces lativittatus]